MMDQETKSTMKKKSRSKKNKPTNNFEAPKEETKKEEPKRSENPPKKSEGIDAWFNWYRDEIRDRVAKGETFDNIKKDLNITHVEKFLNNER